MPRVVVIGSINTDMTVRVPRLPAPGRTVLGGEFASTPGGKGANQAMAALRAGATVRLIAAVGDDALGRASIARYRDQGLEVEHIRVVPAVASGVALIYVADDGENMIAVAPGANASLSPQDIADLPDRVLSSDGVLLMSLEIPLETARAAMIRGRNAGMTVILNPAPVAAARVAETSALLELADFATPNRDEARALVGLAEGALLDPREVADRLLAQGPRGVVVTRGSQGCLVAEPGACRRLKAVKVPVVDTVGAGDAYTGALSVAIAEGKSLVDAAIWASQAASLAVTRPGAQAALPIRSEIDRLAEQCDELLVHNDVK